MPSRQRSTSEFIAVYNRHVDAVYRLCYSFMKNRPDTEDMVQETFLRYLSNRKVFENDRHEKAWFIVTASNLCKDNLKRKWRTEESLDCAADIFQPEPQDYSVLDAILQLPEDYKEAVYLYYYEGYTTGEIARYTGCQESTIRSRLMRARKKLETLLGGGNRCAAK